MVRQTIPLEKDLQRAKIKRDTEKFLAKGGEIERVEFGKYGKEFEGIQDLVVRRFGDHYAK